MPVPPVYAVWDATFESAVADLVAAASPGPLWIDDSLVTPAPIPAAANIDGQGRLDIAGGDFSGTGTVALIDDGAILKNLRAIVGPIEVQATPTTTVPLQWDAQYSSFRLDYSASLLRLEGATLPMIGVAAPMRMFISRGSYIRDQSLAAVRIVDVTSQLVLSVTTNEGGVSFTNTVSGGMFAVLSFIRDASVDAPAMPNFVGFIFTTPQIDQANNLVFSSGALRSTTIETSLSTADLQAAGAVATFTYNAGLMPTPGYLVRAEIEVPDGLAAAGLASAVATLQGGADAAGTIVAGSDVTAVGVLAATGTNPYVSRSGQQIAVTVTIVGATLDNLTAGALTVRLFIETTP